MNPNTPPESILVLGASSNGTGTAIAEQAVADGEAVAYVGSADIAKATKIFPEGGHRFEVRDIESVANGVLKQFKALLEAGINPNVIFNAIASLRMQTYPEHSEAGTLAAFEKLESGKEVLTTYYAEAVKGHATIHELWARLLKDTVNFTLSYSPKFPQKPEEDIADSGSQKTTPALYPPTIGKWASEALAKGEISTTLTEEEQAIWEGELTKFISENHALIISVLGAEWSANNDFDSPLENLRTVSLPETQSPAANFSGIDYQIVWRFAAEFWEDEANHNHLLVEEIISEIPHAEVIMNTLKDANPPAVDPNTTYKELTTQLAQNFKSLEFPVSDQKTLKGTQIVGLIHLMAKKISDYYKAAQAQGLLEERDTNVPFQLWEPADLLERTPRLNAKEDPQLSSDPTKKFELWNGRAYFQVVGTTKDRQTIYQIPPAELEAEFLQGHTYINPGMTLLAQHLLLNPTEQPFAQIQFSGALYPADLFYLKPDSEKGIVICRYPDHTELGSIKQEVEPLDLSGVFSTANSAEKSTEQDLSINPYDEVLFHADMMALASNPAEFKVQTIAAESTTKSPQLLISTEIEAPTRFGERVPATIIWEQVMQQLVAGAVQVTYPKPTKKADSHEDETKTFAQLNKDPRVVRFIGDITANISAGSAYSIELLVNESIRVKKGNFMLGGKICLTDANGKKHYAEITCALQ